MKNMYSENYILSDENINNQLDEYTNSIKKYDLFISLLIIFLPLSVILLGGNIPSIIIAGGTSGIIACTYFEMIKSQLINNYNNKLYGNLPFTMSNEVNKNLIAYCEYKESTRPLIDIDRTLSDRQNKYISNVLKIRELRYGDYLIFSNIEYQELKNSLNAILIDELRFKINKIKANIKK